MRALDPGWLEDCIDDNAAEDVAALSTLAADERDKGELGVRHLRECPETLLFPRGGFRFPSH